jgi:hypothetical protein
VEHSPSQNVNVQVEDGLPRASAVVDDGPVSPGLEAARAGKLGGDLKEVPEEQLIFRPRIAKSGEVSARDHQQVNGRLRMEVLNRDYRLVFVDDLSRRFALDDSAKDAMVHGISLSL